MYMTLHGRVALGYAKTEPEAKQLAELHYQMPAVWRDLVSTMPSHTISLIDDLGRITLQDRLTWEFHVGGLISAPAEDKFYRIEQLAW